MKKKILITAGLFLLIAIVAVCYAAATATVNLTCTVAGLGSSSPQLSVSFTDGTAPTAAVYYYTTQTDINTAEAIALGDVSSVKGILMKCDANDFDVDCDYNSTNFDPDINLDEGEAAFFVPAGTVYIMNTDSGEKAVYEYIVYGTK